MYRGQFAYSTPEGCRDEDFVYYFDGSNTPLLNQDFAVGLTVLNIPLPLQQDAPFYWRGFKVENRGAGGGPATPNLFCRFRDPYLNFLSEGMICAMNLGFAQNPFVFNGADYTGTPVPLEPEIYCPAGGLIQLDIIAPVTAGVTAFPLVTLYGVKRFKECAQ